MKGLSVGVQRRIALGLVVAWVVGVVLAGWLVPMPYVVYRPGPTINVLGAESQFGGPS